MFSETSHHRNIPFLGKNIPYLEGGPGGERGKTKRLKFFYLPRAIFAIPGPLGNLPFYCCFRRLGPLFFTVIFSFENKIKSLVSSRQVLWPGFDRDYCSYSPQNKVHYKMSGNSPSL